MQVEIMIREIVFIVLLFPVTQQSPLEKKESVLSESRLQNEYPIGFNLIPSTTPYHLTKAHPLRRKSRNVFKLPNDVLDSREGNIHKSEHSSKSKLDRQVSSNGISKSRNVFKLPNSDRIIKGPNVWKTRGPNLWTTKGPNVWKTRGPNVWKTRGPNIHTTKEPNVWKTRGPNVLTTKGPNMWTTKEPNVWKTRGPNIWKTRGPNVWRTRGPNVWRTKGPTVQPTEKFTNNNIKTTSIASSNDSETRGPTVKPNENVSKLSQATDDTNNIGTVVAPIVACILLLAAIIILIVLFKSKCIRINNTRQRQTINGEIPNQHDTKRQLILVNGQTEPISGGIENGTD
ncbi:uncharacterized protein LOC143058319 [Mytilus galloprovincialis]|uniref:uncharacterized protein LOC143058319 n=1 Tax=Mytilus galloprovincialis TaxID=29158 RepID=UPI003F7B6F52